MAKTHTTTLPTPRPIDEVWEEFRLVQSEDLRNLLIVEYLPLVKYHAERVHAKLPEEVDVDDLCQAGTFGLKDAVGLFDPTLGYKFETYASPRIRGAILDELRSMDWVPRIARQRSTRHEHVSREFQHRHGRAPADSEMAKILGLSKQEYERARRDSTVAHTVSINAKIMNNKDPGSRETPCHEEAMALADTAVSEATRNDVKEFISKGLNRTERMILVLYYYEDMTMKEIGATLDLSESRVSQMHGMILERIRSRIDFPEHILTPE